MTFAVGLLGLGVGLALGWVMREVVCLVNHAEMEMRVREAERVRDAALFDRR